MRASDTKSNTILLRVRNIHDSGRVQRSIHPHFAVIRSPTCIRFAPLNQSCTTIRTRCVLSLGSRVDPGICWRKEIWPRASARSGIATGGRAGRLTLIIESDLQQDAVFTA
jgi:hypothetical protein